ncbi:tyrosine-type recombinase/integrase [Sulfurimonas sp.]|uniref:tyrosine-type recombinase/integrase n=1 Tax=Sulfurimonas sp. TaxID=2022749 RepID=UPI003D09926B
MSLIVSGVKSPNKGDKKVTDIKASILNRSNRKHWYLRYQLFFENSDVEKHQEISTKVLKTEKTLKYMQTQYLPAWIAKKQNELLLQKFDNKKFSCFYEKYLIEHESNKGFFNRLPTYRKVLKYFGEFEVSKINRQMVKDFLFSLGDIKNDSKKKYLTCIKGILDIALDSDLITRNVAKDIAFAKETKEAINPFSGDEIALLLNNADQMLKNYLGIAFYTGMRSGEILGLMHGDILSDKISVKRSISRGNITSPKTMGSIRDIPIFESVKPFLREQIKQSSKSLYLFSQNGTNIDDVSFFRYRWRELLKACNIPYRTIYNTRHTFITAMLNSGKFKIMDIAAIVGHTSPQMIMTRYAGFIKENHLKIDTNLEIFSDSFGDNLKFKID